MDSGTAEAAGPAEQGRAGHLRRSPAPRLQIRAACRQLGSDWIMELAGDSSLESGLYVSRELEIEREGPGRGREHDLYVRRLGGGGRGGLQLRVRFARL